MKILRIGPIVTAVLLNLSLFFAADSALGKKRSEFTLAEIQTLVNDVSVGGWSAQRKRNLFQQSGVEKINDMIKLNVTKPIILKHDKYQHFLDGPAIAKATKFKKKWRTLLRKAGRKYKVNPETIVAIMLVETQFGRFLGKYNVVSVFASTYVDAKALSENSQNLTAKMKKRVNRKKKWALGELKALLKMQNVHGTDIVALKGSYAGAFGMCQFLPSSYLHYAAKGIGSGAPNLFWEPDAIYSVARYLSKHGYRKGTKFFTRPNRKSVKAYNYSDVYVDTVLGAAVRIKTAY